jgi:hypothetical protein
MFTPETYLKLHVDKMELNRHDTVIIVFFVFLKRLD